MNTTKTTKSKLLCTDHDSLYFDKCKEVSINFSMRYFYFMCLTCDFFNYSKSYCRRESFL